MLENHSVKIHSAVIVPIHHLALLLLGAIVSFSEYV